MVDSLVWETISNHESNDPIKHYMLNNRSTKDANPEVAMSAQFLKASPQVLAMLVKVETLVSDVKSSSDKERAPQVQLKPLPSSLRYEFLRPNSMYPIMVNASLSASQTDSLLRILRRHSKAIAYTLDGLKEIHPSVCIHRILMEDDQKPSIEHQRRLNLNMQVVVKKEILKLLKVGIIYPISYSKWVSSVHVIPKKGGMIVIKNENNELIPTKAMTGWRMCIDYRKFSLPFID